MSDRTNGNATVTFDHRPTEAEVAKWAEVIEGFGEGEPDWDAGDFEQGGTTLGAGWNEVIPIHPQGWAEELHKVFPDAEVRCWDEPAYEWLGTLTVYRKGEMLTAQCDSNGTPFYQIFDIQKAVENTATYEELVAAIAALDI